MVELVKILFAYSTHGNCGAMGVGHIHLLILPFRLAIGLGVEPRGPPVDGGLKQQFTTVPMVQIPVTEGYFLLELAVSNVGVRTVLSNQKLNPCTFFFR